MQARQYDPSTVMTITGEVTSVHDVGYQGVHLLVQTDQETVEVHLGPNWYLEAAGFTVATGDRIEVTGSRIDQSGTPNLIAAQVKSGDQVLILRDANGLPMWRGRGQSAR
ncbi:DNA-binding protein [Egbenema bharatensis]|uniref:DNA-binding protein n=1 Tax=Egbenema bharatensis TaxID=3463334 RepID=UPI003A840ACA